MIDLVSHGILIATGLAAIAAVFSAIAAWRAPLISAKVARAQERQRIRHYIFFTLMQSRASTTRESVAALNSIDIAFHDDTEVREAWADMYHAANSRDAALLEEKRRILLHTMGKSLGLAGEIRRDDLSRVYYPNIIAEEDFLNDIKRREALSKLPASTPPSANAAVPRLPESTKDDDAS